MINRFREYINANQFNALKITIASPEKVLSLSYGEVKKIETINYRTLKPERDGLFCARIFGPVKDWECNCGKYKRMKHRGITCEKCGVEVIQSRVRRERMGHIKLVAPVCHIWYLKGIPSYLGLLLDLPVKDLERIIYFDAYMVVDQSKSPYARKTLLSSADYDNYLDLHPEDTAFRAETGAEAVRLMLSMFDLPLEIAQLQQEYTKTTSVAARHKIMRRIKVLTGLHQAGIRPEWMVMTVLPVLPPDLRPLVPLEGGRFASSDLNELYRRVLNRNIRLARLMEIDAPSVIIKNEKRMLQEAVDALIDNGRRGQPVRGSNKRPLKSLSEMLRGKQGRFRQNLLGKRVDYSGRSVIVVDPELKIDQCGLPKAMALELFKSHILAGLLASELAPNLRAAKRMVEDSEPVVWDVLADVVKDQTVLLNRAPTLHRLGIQAFRPILVDGKSIKIHPLVCKAFNADFDGDQMAVHIPLSAQAREESKNLILSTRNILSPANGRPIMVPSQDMILGLHYLTKVRYNVLGEGLVFSSPAEVVAAYEHGRCSLHARVKVRMADKMVETTVGRIILFVAIPEGSDFEWVNKILTTSDLSKLVERVYYRFGSEATVVCLDNIKKLGFKHSTFAGISFSMKDMITPDKKESIIKKAEKEVQKVEQMYLDGIITNGERYNKVVSLWARATTDVAQNMTVNLSQQDTQAYLNEEKTNQPFNSIFLMLESGAKGSRDQIKQLVGMRGLMARPSGDIMETPVKSNFKDGLSVFEYFISTHGARKGQADTALKTANAGYLTRKLIDVAQDVVITMTDCKTLGSIMLEDLQEGGDIIYPLANRGFSRVVATDVKDEISGQLIFKQGHIIRREDIEKISNAVISKIPVRSVLTCQSKRGVCAACYGLDMSKNDMVEIGSTVGIIAAQSIGEPGTQLTMRTFHIGGTASLSEQSSFVSKVAGKVVFTALYAEKNKEGQTVVMNRSSKMAIVSPDGRELQRHDLEYGSVLLVQEGQDVLVGTKLVEWDLNNKVILTEKSGKVRYVDMIDNLTVQERYDEATSRTTRMVVDHKGDKYQPAISIVDEDDNEIVQYYIPTGAYVNVDQNQLLKVGDVIAKLPREASRTKDITTGGLPRISEFFEARAPKDPAILSDIDGEVVFGGLHRGLRKVSVTNGVETFDYFIPRSKQLNVVNGDRVKAGDLITQGTPILHDVLRISGPEALQRYLVNQVQEVYRRQGVDINDRHIELIVRQMSRKVRVIEPGDTEFLIGDRVDRIHFKAVNDALVLEGKRPAVAKQVLQGITLASLGTESFISAASFQETTRILAEAAIFGQTDHLYGLKENVIIGKIIPAGTGITSFRKKYHISHKTDTVKVE